MNKKLENGIDLELLWHSRKGNIWLSNLMCSHKRVHRANGFRTDNRLIPLLATNHSVFVIPLSSKLQERDSNGRFAGHAKDLPQSTNGTRKLVTSTGQKVLDIMLSGFQY